MNCSDCATTRFTTLAVAVCHDCGARVCGDHAATTSHHFTRIVPLGRHVAIEPAGRIIRCNTCAAAATAGQHRLTPHRAAVQAR
jgi:hypothetical protein